MTTRGRPHRALRLGGAAILSVGLAVGGCATKVAVSRDSRPARRPPSSVTIFSSEAVSAFTKRSTGRSLVSCITESLRAKAPALRFVPPEDFVRRVFPGLEPAAAPLGPASLAVVAGDAGFRARVTEAGVDYLITVEGLTTDFASGPIRFPYGAVDVRDRDSRAVARVYDLRDVSSVATTSVHVSGHPVFGAGMIPPFIYVAPAFTETRACGRLGREVGELVGGGEALPP